MLIINRDSCVKVLYTKKDKFATKLVYVPDKKFTPAPKTLHRHACDKFQVCINCALTYFNGKATMT